MIALAIPVGCGDDDDAEGEGVTTSSLSKTEHVKQANKVCADGDVKSFEKLGTLVEDKQSSEKEIAAATTEIVIQDSQVQLEELRELGAPRGSEDEVEAMLVAMQEGLDEAQSKGIEDPEEFAEGLVRFDKLAQKYGLDSCNFNF